MHEAMHDALITNLAKFMRNNGLVETNIAEHQRGADGKCVCCKTGETTYTPWPCTTYQAATAAAARRLG